MEGKIGGCCILQILANLLIDFLLVFLPVAYLKSKRKNVLESLGLRKIPLPELAKQTIVLFVALFAVSLVLSFAMHQLGISDLQKVEQTLKDLMKTAPLLVVYAIIVRPFAEEIFFRAFLTPRLGILVSSLVFGAAHFFYGSMTEMIGAFVLGLILAYFYMKNKNLLPNIFAHYLYNFVALFLVDLTWKALS